ncbi:alpha/beta hydrolase family protein [Kribbella sp. NBC_00359]|uniref:alpha/beta hydrolase family protein n=1 Tax=Kribbella sp. NBC_00359 TaxID=2975966 RepID=UPI002E21F69A
MTEWTHPPYADPTRFTEQETVLNAGGRAVPGTVTLPERPNGIGVVLLSGGGPFDRDETSGPNKPLKDLAWGLASSGVTVLRFDKVSFARPALMTEPGFKMTADYVPHAIAAVHELREYIHHVFLIGHSMGGKVAPKIAAEEPSVAGLIIMAGDTQPMQHAAVRVMSYLATTSPEAVPVEVVEQFKRQAAVVDGPDLSPNTPSTDLPFGMPASFWLELRDYDPVAIAAKVDVPILILQGGRDYQVTVADDLPAWRDGLPDAAIRVLEADNHLFFPGTGPSTPADYVTAQHVGPEALTIITTWMLRTTRS